MSTHKSIDKICVIAVVLTLIAGVLFCSGDYFGIESAARNIGYENRLFDNSKVHTFDIVIDDWDAFISTCESEEYTVCSVIIDGEAVRNVGIRGKGNTSLSSVKNLNSSRYSFKIEFDQYDSAKTYYGLDKLCLNNIIQDNTYMKDYIAYTLMNSFGVDAPLCSFVYITVNGEDWGLYLAVEAVEDTFLQRNYGTDYGELYKPDSMSFGGGRGNGMDFSMSDFINENSGDSENSEQSAASFAKPGFGGNMPEGVDPSQMFRGEGMPQFNPDNVPEGLQPPDASGVETTSDGEKTGHGGKGGFGMGSDDVKLKYIDDDPESYSNIFDNAKTNVSTADKARLINALRNLSEQTDIESTVDVEEVIRYFVVHNFLQNGDSYTGQMIHNYYLYEKDGKLSMIPWDYNLAYGSFSGTNASSAVNAPIDTPVSGSTDDRPMISWIFGSEEYTGLYHTLFNEFIDSVDIGKLIDDTAAMIDSYVQKDPTKFCTYEEFQKGVAAIRSFCTLRTESVKCQLDGTIPTTASGQQSDSSALIGTGDLIISDMGSMGNGPDGNGGFGHGGKERFRNGFSDEQNTAVQDPGSSTDTAGDIAASLNTQQENFDPSQRSAEDFVPPNGRSDKAEAPETGNSMGYILLGISALILIPGIIFAGMLKK